MPLVRKLTRYFEESELVKSPTEEEVSSLIETDEPYIVTPVFEPVEIPVPAPLLVRSPSSPQLSMPEDPYAGPQFKTLARSASVSHLSRMTPGNSPFVPSLANQQTSPNAVPASAQGVAAARVPWKIVDRSIALPDKIAQDDDERGVKHILNAKRLFERFEVSVGANLWRRKMIFDTPTIRKGYAQKTTQRLKKNKTTYEIGKANPFKGGTSLARKADSLQPLGSDWSAFLDGLLIWVCVPDEQGGKVKFYSNVPKAHHFHHSSFTGGTVVGAGEWVVRKGKIDIITGQSGHYKPPIDALEASLLRLMPALTNNSRVLLWDKEASGGAGAYNFVKAFHFLEHGSEGGRYTVSQAAT